MQAIAPDYADPVCTDPSLRTVTTAVDCLPGPCDRALQDHQFALMKRAYAGSGGLATGDEVAGLMRTHADQPISRLARWIVTRSVLSFVWRSQTWLPLFQFDRSDISLRPGTLAVVRELACVFDEWELAIWFCSPNAWLQNAAPADVVECDVSGVLHAARADRFVAAG